MSACSSRKVAGFTLTEMLATMLILTLVATLMATGIPVAIETYHKTVNGANAQVALSTTITVLRGELSTSPDVLGAEDGMIYYQAEDGEWARIRNSTAGDAGVGRSYHGIVKEYLNDNGGAVSSIADLTPYVDAGGDPSTKYVYPLVSDAAITDALYVSFGSITLSGDQVQIEKLRVDDVPTPDRSTQPLAGVGDSGSPFRILLRFETS